jgi:hypothetical protein
MGRPFPDLPIYANFEAPGRVEAEAIDLEVEGAIPSLSRRHVLPRRTGPAVVPALGNRYFLQRRRHGCRVSVP